MAPQVAGRGAEARTPANDAPLRAVGADVPNLTFRSAHLDAHSSSCQWSYQEARGLGDFDVYPLCANCPLIACRETWGCLAASPGALGSVGRACCIRVG